MLWLTDIVPAFPVPGNCRGFEYFCELTSLKKSLKKFNFFEQFFIGWKVSLTI
jgi:hypothetical protein